MPSDNIKKERANNCKSVFNFAILETGMLIFIPAKYSLKLVFYSQIRNHWRRHFDVDYTWFVVFVETFGDLASDELLSLYKKQFFVLRTRLYDCYCRLSFLDPTLFVD